MIRLLFLIAALVLGPALAAEDARGGAVAEAMKQPLSLGEPPALAPPDPATVDARTQSLASQMRCPVCQGLSVADSNSEAARNMRQRIRELVEQGYSDEQIKRYFVSRFGQWIVLEPEPEGLGLVVFVAPVLAVLVGAAVIARRLAGGEEEGEPSTEEIVRSAGLADDPYRRRVLEELGDIDGEGT